MTANGVSKCCYPAGRLLVTAWFAVDMVTAWQVKLGVGLTYFG